MKAVSVIVATCNRPQDLQECLASILASHYPVHEVLIMDQSDDGASRQVVDGFGDPRLEYFHLDIKGKSRALNLALRVSKGEILCFTDDDCMAIPGWVQAIAEEFEVNDRLGAVFGQVLPKVLHSDAPPLATITTAKRRVFTRHRNPYDVGGGNNMSFRREAVARIGDFDELLGPGARFQAAEDNEYIYRAFKLGLQAVQCPKALVYHKQNRDRLAVAQRLRDYRLGDAALIAKHLLRLDPLPLAFYLTWQVKETSKALVTKDFGYLRHTLRDFKLTMQGMAAYMRWRSTGGLPASTGGD